MRFAAAVLLIAALACAGILARQPADFFPVGVRYQLDPDPARRRQDLEEIRRLRFTVVALGEEDSAGDTELGLVERLLGGAPDTRIRMSGVARIADDDTASDGSARLAAWYALGMGARGIIFGEWTALQQRTGVLTAAVEFADHVARNSALYAPLRPRVPRDGAPDVAVKGNDPRISARMLESDDALLLVAANHHTAGPIEVTLTFSREMPEAIWQNMLTGASVQFVAGPDGPVYTKTFPPEEVLVLMIRKHLK